MTRVARVVGGTQGGKGEKGRQDSRGEEDKKGGGVARLKRGHGSEVHGGSQDFQGSQG